MTTNIDTRILSVSSIVNIQNTSPTAGSHTWAQFLEILRQYPSTGETLAEYENMTKAKQNQLKSGALFLGGTFNGKGRKEEHLISRSFTALDVDEGVDAQFIPRVSKALEGVAYAMYETRNSRSNNRRYRIIIPFDRDVSIAEYKTLITYITYTIGAHYFDDSMKRPAQFTYYPSYSSDQDINFQVSAGALLDVNEYLRRASAYDMLAIEQDTTRKRFTKQANKKADPHAIPGAVGAFNRAISIEEALDEYIPDVYEEQGNGRFLFSGSTSGAPGAEIIETQTGEFFASSHDSDPAQGLNHAYDLVRIHKFGELDAGTRTQKIESLPSTKAMLNFLSADDNFKRKAAAQTAGIEDADEDAEWLAELRWNNDGSRLQASTYNIMLIANNDTRIKDAFTYDEFKHQINLKNNAEWREIPDLNPANQAILDAMRARGESDEAIERRRDGMIREEKSGDFEDEDTLGLRLFYSTHYDLDLREPDAAAIIRHIARKNKAHPIREYLERVRGAWDGVPRVRTMFTDYLGAEDNELNREIAKLFIKGAIARIQAPGVDFQHIVVLQGDQGLGKSIFFKNLAGGDEFFTDSIDDIQHKDAAQALHGNWIAELAELTALQRKTAEAAKQFTSKSTDKMRLPYAKEMTEHPRQVVIVGTSNPYEFLTDMTGNRRFLVVRTGEIFDKHEVYERKLQEQVKHDRDQIWAEALEIYAQEPSLNLPQDMVTKAEERALEHTTFAGTNILVDAWIDADVPVNLKAWHKATLTNRHVYVMQNKASASALRNAMSTREVITSDMVARGYKRRETFCLPEAIEEITGEHYHDLNPGKRNRIEAAIKAHPAIRLEEDESGKKTRRRATFGAWKRQYVYEIQHDVKPITVSAPRHTSE